MLNRELHLNNNVFDKEVEKRSTREGYGDGLLILGEENPNVVALSADVADSTKNTDFRKKFPERFFNCGVAEQNMASVAAGLAVSGKIPFISSYATFSPGRNWEQIRTTIIYNRANVKIAGHHTGVATGPDGPTHQATEDIAIVRSWPGIKVVVPCDAIEGKKAMLAAGKDEGPYYLRFTREKTPTITTDNTPFEVGKVYEYWRSKKPEVTIFAIGFMVFYALLAAKQLEQNGVGSIVVNAASLKPLDVQNVIELASETGRVVTAEDHQVMGGLGGVISETLAKHKPLPVEMVGLQDKFAEAGDFDSLLEKYHMDDAAIVSAVNKVIKRK